MFKVKIVDYVVNADLNIDLKMAKEGLSQITSGKLLYSLGAAC